jgi:small multidrug resistance family-3 protein
MDVCLRVVDGVKLSALDWAGAGVALLGMSIIALGWQDRAWRTIFSVS